MINKNEITFEFNGITYNFNEIEEDVLKNITIQEYEEKDSDLK